MVRSFVVTCLHPFLNKKGSGFEKYKKLINDK